MWLNSFLISHILSTEINDQKMYYLHFNTSTLFVMAIFVVGMTALGVSIIFPDIVR